MFTKNQYYMVWQMAVQECKKLNRKTFGANESERRTMDYKILKDRETQWEAIKEAAANAFINYEDMDQLLGDGN